VFTPCKQDANGGLPSVRRERKNSKKSMSSFMPLSQNPINTSTSSLGSFSSEEDDLSDDSDDSDLFSSPDSPESPVPLDSPVIHTRLPTTPGSSPFMPQQQYLQVHFLFRFRYFSHFLFHNILFLSLNINAFLQELQFQQQIHQAMLVNPFMGEGPNTYSSWDWSLPNQQQINVHTAGASMPIAMNQGHVSCYTEYLFNLPPTPLFTAVSPPSTLISHL
jgi:hypothetical protein